jgi:integrase
MKTVKQIIPAEKVQLTIGKIGKLQCTGEKKRVYLWDNEVKGFGVIATDTGGKSFIFQAKINGKSVRLTISKVGVLSISEARSEAHKLQVLIDQGIDPRQEAADKEAAEQAAAAAKKAQEARETVTISKAWTEYVEAMKSTWGELHLHDHMRAMQSGGEKRTRSNKLTEPGTLASLADVRLIDLTNERLTAWSRIEGAKRPSRARNARTLLSTFLNWCISHPIYGQIITTNPAQSKEIKKYLGKPIAKNDALQREQLPAWFNAIKQIQNPVISAYLQALFLTGARSNEMVSIRWEDVDFQWNTLTIKDKVEGLRVIPLTPYVSHLLAMLPRRNEWVFSSLTSASGHIVEARIAHDKACAIAGLDVTLHGLRRSFASLCEWIEMPAGIAAQIQGHKPQGVREKHYIRRPLDLLRMWHVKIETWILGQAGIEFIPTQAGLQIVKQ